MIKNDCIDWVNTKNEIELIVEKYNLYVLSINVSTEEADDILKLKLLSVNDVNSRYMKISGEEIRDRLEYINYVRFSYNKLTTLERKIIYWTYFDREDNYDDRFIANNLGFSLGYYYIKKKEALIRFSYALGVEVSNNKTY